MADYLNDIPELLAELKKLGFKVKSYSDSPEAFGNFIVSFTDGKFSFEFTRDRSQYILEGSNDELAQYGLNRAFDEKGEFQKQLLVWLKEQLRQQAMKKSENFSFKRMSYFTAWLGLAFIPLHFFVSCKASGLLLLFSACLLVITVIFSIPQKGDNRLKPILIALIVLILNGLITH